MKTNQRNGNKKWILICTSFILVSLMLTQFVFAGKLPGKPSAKEIEIYSLINETDGLAASTDSVKLTTVDKTYANGLISNKDGNLCYFILRPELLKDSKKVEFEVYIKGTTAKKPFLIVENESGVDLLTKKLEVGKRTKVSMDNAKKEMRFILADQEGSFEKEQLIIGEPVLIK